MTQDMEFIQQLHQEGFFQYSNQIKYTKYFQGFYHEIEPTGCLTPWRNTNDHRYSIFSSPSSA